MKQKTFLNITGTVFAIVSLLHLIRAVFKIPALIGLWNAPIWISFIGFIISGYLSYEAFRLNRKK